MSITRSPRRVTWTQIDNKIIEDRRIPLDSLGLLVYLLSKPDHWNVVPKTLCEHLGIGRQMMYRMLGQLRDLGYAEYTRYTNGTTDWKVSETRMDTPYAAKPEEAKPEEAKQHVVVKTERAVKTERKLMVKTAFDRVWTVWPKKKAKSEGLMAFQSASKKMDEAELTVFENKLIADITTRVKSDADWQNVKYVPAFDRYIRRERWEDSITPITAETKQAVLPRADTDLETWAKNNGQRTARIGESYADYRQYLYGVMR